MKDVLKIIEGVQVSPVGQLAASMLGVMITAKVVRRLLDASLTPAEKRKRARRKLICRAMHPTRTKYFGVAKCRRQMFLNRRLFWSR